MTLVEAIQVALRANQHRHGTMRYPCKWCDEARPVLEEYLESEETDDTHRNRR